MPSMHCMYTVKAPVCLPAESQSDSLFPPRTHGPDTWPPAGFTAGRTAVFLSLPGSSRGVAVKSTRRSDR